MKNRTVVGACQVGKEKDPTYCNVVQEITDLAISKNGYVSEDDIENKILGREDMFFLNSGMDREALQKYMKRMVSEGRLIDDFDAPGNYHMVLYGGSGKKMDVSKAAARSPSKIFDVYSKRN